MALESKTISGKRYYYFRYYYRSGGEKRYVERYCGSKKPTKRELDELRSQYREMVAQAREGAAPPRPVSSEEEELPVYLL